MRKDLQYILALNENRDLQKAAESLYISAPALSKYIMSMEKKAGVKLIEKRRDRWELTPAGERYVEYMLDINAMEERLQSEMNMFAHETSRVIRIGLTGGTFARFVNEILPEINRQYPDIVIEAMEGDFISIRNALLDGTVNFGLIRNQALENETRLECMGSLDIPVLLVANSDDPAVAAAQPREGFCCPWVETSAIDGKRCIVPIKTGEEYNRVFRRYFPKSFLGPRFRSGDRGSIIVTVSKNSAFAISFSDLMFEAKHLNKAAFLSFGEEQLYCRYDMVYRRNHPLEAMEKKILDMILQGFVYDVY